MRQCRRDRGVNLSLAGAKSKRPSEVPIAIKTRQVLYSKVEAAIRRIPPLRTSRSRRCPDYAMHLAAYLDWIDTETRG